MSLEARYEKWHGWLTARGRIRQDVYSMVYQRQMWVGFDLLATVNEHDRKNPLFFTWVREGYVTSVASGIRVQSDRDRRSISLTKMLEEMVAYPRAISRARYLKQRDATSPSSHYWDWANEGFDELAGSGKFMDPALPTADLDRLAQTTDPIRKAVNAGIAHANKRTERFKGKLRPEDLSPALDLLLELTQKYSNLLVNVSIASDWSLPAWWLVFREPWEAPNEILGQLS